MAQSTSAERWLEDHGDALFGFAFMRLRDRETAEDMVQETLLAAWRSRESFAATSSERTWLIGILKHKLADHWRRSARQPSDALEADAADDLIEKTFDMEKGGPWRVPPSAWANPDTALEQQQFWQIFIDCVGALPPAPGWEGQDAYRQILGSTPRPEGLFMQQMVRTTIAEADARVPRMLICDRDWKWSHDVRRRLQEAGIRVVLIPEGAPNANAERFVRSVKEECLDRIVPFGERHFRRAVAEYIKHYHGERNHQGLENRRIAGPAVIDRTGRVRRRSRLGGLLNFYERAA